MWRSTHSAVQCAPLPPAPPHPPTTPLPAQPAARRRACPPPQPAAAAGGAQHAWPADMQSRRDSHRAPPGRPVSLKIGLQIKSNQIKSPHPTLPTTHPPLSPLPEPPPSDAPPPPPPKGPSAHFYWGGESRTKARRRPPRVRNQPHDTILHAHYRGYLKIVELNFLFRDRWSNSEVMVVECEAAEPEARHYFRRQMSRVSRFLNFLHLEPFANLRIRIGFSNFQMRHGLFFNAVHKMQSKTDFVNFHVLLIFNRIFRC